MAWIQNSLRNILFFLLLLSCILNPVSHSFAQSNSTTISPQLPNHPILKNHSFYFEDVEDLRKSAPDQLGKIISTGKESGLFLNTSLKKFALDHWRVLAPKRKNEDLPLQIQIQEFQINEKRDRNQKIAGEAKISLSYSWMRDGVRVPLGSFGTTANYIRTDKQSFDYNALINQIMDQPVKYFQRWMLEHGKDNPALARTVKIVFRELANPKQSDTVFYNPNRPLIWSDFKGATRSNSKYAAAVFTSFSYEGKSYAKDSELIIDIGFKVYMVKNMSWGNPQARNSYTLRHEQLHFDITRILVEQFKKRILESSLTLADYDSELQYQFLEIYKEMHREQDLYDKETQHGLNPQKQAAWDDKITKQLKTIFQGIE
jgi:hypothetical protein